MAAETPLLDRQLLEKLERLTIHWQKSFAGLVGGHNVSRFAGPGQEFLDHRSFHHGDDLRAVNWRAYLRLEKLFLKMFQVEPRVPVRMLVDASSSMSTHGGLKMDYARKLAAALCYVGLVRLDSIEVHGFSDRLAMRLLSTGGRHRISAVMDGIAAIPAGGRPSSRSRQHSAGRRTAAQSPAYLWISSSSRACACRDRDNRWPPRHVAHTHSKS